MPAKYTEHVTLNEFTEGAYGHAAEEGVLGIILHNTATDTYWEKSSTAAIFFDPERALNHRPVKVYLLIIAIYSNQNMHFFFDGVKAGEPSFVRKTNVPSNVNADMF